MTRCFGCDCYGSKDNRFPALLVSSVTKFTSLNDLDFCPVTISTWPTYLLPGVISDSALFDILRDVTSVRFILFTSIPAGVEGESQSSGP